MGVLPWFSHLQPAEQVVVGLLGSVAQVLLVLVGCLVLLHAF